MVATSRQPAPHSSPDSDSRLRGLVVLATGLPLVSLATEASAFARRVAEGRFYVACIGQFKRGKSTLVNALVGEEILPAGVLPVTSVVTVVRHGAERYATIRFLDGTTERVPLQGIAAYVAEKENPENAKEVSGVEVFVPSTLLSSGMCLVDTPGIGSVFTGNTEATRAFVPHIDAALVVLGADPPISADELTLIQEIGRQTEEPLFVFSKADRSSDTDRQEARAFCERVLAARLGHAVGPILEVSATEQLTGCGHPRDWPVLLGRLQRLAEQSGSHLVRAAEERGLSTLGARLLREVAEREAALQRPAEESARRIEALKRCAAQAERSRSDLGYLLDAEQTRLHEAFTSRQEEFLVRVRETTHAELQDALRQAAHRGNRADFWRDANRLAQEIFRRLLDSWRREQQPVGEQMYREATRRFIALANAFLERLAAEGGLPPADVPQVLGEEQGFRTKSRLYFTELLYTTTRAPFQWLLDVLRPPGSFRRAVERHAHAYLDHIIVTNATRVTSKLDEQVFESRQRLEQELRARLRGIYEVAERALELAQAQRARGAEATQAELQRLADLRRSAEKLLPDVPPTAASLDHMRSGGTT